MQQQYIEALKKQLNKTQSSKFDVDLWKVSTISLVRRIFGDNTIKIQQLGEVVHEKSVSVSGYVYQDNIEQCRARAKGLMAAYIKELQEFGIPDLSQQVSAQTSTTPQADQLSQDILQIVDYELTGRQYKSLQRILESEQKEAAKLSALIDTIKTFGADAIAHIFAHILLKVKP